MTMIGRGMTSQVAILDALAGRLSSSIKWPQLSIEQQNRRLILALAERLK